MTNLQSARCLWLAFLVLSLSCVSLVAGDDGEGGGGGGDDFDFGGMGGMGKPCPNYRCSSGMTPVQKSRPKFTSPGCSAMGGGMMMMATGAETAKKPFESCCDAWHACYQICGSSKKNCDDTFKTCSEAMCQPYGEDCSRDANLSSMMMNLGGCSKFNKDQYANCQCVEKGDKADKQREQALRYFYKKFNPGSEEKVKDLAKKVDGPSKMAALFKKLVQKYPNSIQKVEDPEKKMYEEMMRKAKTEVKEEGEAADEDQESDEHEEL